MVAHRPVRVPRHHPRLQRPVPVQLDRRHPHAGRAHVDREDPHVTASRTAHNPVATVSLPRSAIFSSR